MADATRNWGGTKRVPKLRASCDSCNESKVRCTQTKPSCARCVKNDVHCVYGISQRSGKHSAGSYSSRHTQLASAPPTTPNATDLGSPGASSSANSRDFAFPSPVSLHHPKDYSNLLKDQLRSASFDNVFPPNDIFNYQALPDNLDIETLFGMDDPQLLTMHHPTRASVSQTIEGNMHPIKQGSIQSRGAALPHNMDDRDFPGVSNSSLILTEQDTASEMVTCNPPNSSCISCTMYHQIHASPPLCHCHEAIIVQLSSLPVLLHHERCELDVELVQFQAAIKLGTRVLACTCAGKDYTSVLAISMLIARILSVFERGADSAPHGRDISTGDQKDPHSASRPPEISLGTYQMDREEERKLKQEVWWLQSRKVESLVAGFKDMITQDIQQQVYQDVVQAEAWEKLYYLLDQKAQAIKRVWIANRGKG